MSDFITPGTLRQIQARGTAPGRSGNGPPPRGQSCRRCGATFRWEKSGSGYVMCLVAASETCDCGYGRSPGAADGGDDDV